MNEPDPRPAEPVREPPIGWDDDFEEDSDLDEDDDGYEDCGRWRNGRLSEYCALAGTEWCDWECPIGCRGHANASRLDHRP